MTMTIYGLAFSPYVARVALAASAKGMKYKITMPEGGMKTPEMLKLNPFGKMPVLIDGATSLYESGVIIEYLDARGKAKPLIPKGAKAAAAARLIAAVAAEYVQGAGLKIFRYWRNKTNDANLLEEIKAEIAKGLDVLEQVMARGKYAGGSRFSIADTYVIPALYFAVEAGAQAGVADMLGKRKKLKAYWKSIRKDKSIQPALAGMDNRFQQMVAEARG